MINLRPGISTADQAEDRRRLNSSPINLLPPAINTWQHDRVDLSPYQGKTLTIGDPGYPAIKACEVF
jgi:hypothetical protein